MIPRKIISILIVGMLIISLCACSSSPLSGKYTSQNGQYTLDFQSGNKVLWDNSGEFGFTATGTYSKTSDGYEMEIKDMAGMTATFIVTIDNNDLIVTGAGILRNERFVKK